MNKLVNFIGEYEDLLKFCLIMVLFLTISLQITHFFDKELTKEKNIIIKTKKYIIYDNCKSFDSKWYCWED